jgi:hypothetical protein
MTKTPPLSVSRNGHYLEQPGGRFFFWMGDTAWEMLHRLKRPDLVRYLDARAEQCFNVIQVVLVSEFGGFNSKDAYGDSPIDSIAPLHLNERYFARAEEALKLAADRGIYLCLLPLWGEWVTPRESEPVFDNEKLAEEYGWLLGRRLGKHPNVIWCLGGDRMPDEKPWGVAVWRALAKGLQEGEAPATPLMTFHCWGTSAQWFHQDMWLSMHMWGSYHAAFSEPRAWSVAQEDFARKSPKPTLNGEPNYEGHTVNWKPDTGVFTAYDARQAAWWSVMAGACGHTYGHHSIWQFYEKGKHDPISHVKDDWKPMLLADGAGQMRHLKAFVESLPWRTGRPAQELLLSGDKEGSGRVRVFAGKGFVVAYLPEGRTIGLDLKKAGIRKPKARWYDPRTGEEREAAPNAGQPRSFTAPAKWGGRGDDWVLRVENE